jgi:EAL domain-containing protein (putative c-di-GMP-specific phosphodiesterase class I)
MAHALGLRVVAEGVEDDNSLRRLAGYGCDHLQGYRIAPPMPGDDATRWLEACGAAVPLGLVAPA